MMRGRCTRTGRFSGVLAASVFSGLALAEPPRDPSEVVSLEPYLREFAASGLHLPRLNENNDTPNEASDPGGLNAADVFDFLSIDCIPDVMSTIAPIGSIAAVGNYGEPWTIAEGFLAESEPYSLYWRTRNEDLIIADSVRFTVFGPMAIIDDPLTPEFESDAFANPDFLSASKWTIRYYEESGAEGNDLNSPHLPAIDPLTRIGGDNSQELIAKFQWIGERWFEETCVGFSSDAIPVSGIGAVPSSTCLNFSGFGTSCLGAVAFDHPPVPLIVGRCYWVEWVPEFAPTFLLDSFWQLSGSSSLTVFQDAQSWHDTGDPLTGFINGTQRGVDAAMCVDIDLSPEDPNHPCPPGEMYCPLIMTDVGMNLTDYVAMGCRSVICNEPFGVQDTCSEAVAIATLGGFGVSVKGSTFCSDVNGFSNVANPAPSPAGNTVSELSVIQPLWYSVVGNGNEFAVDLCFSGTESAQSVDRSWWIAVYCSSPDGSCQVGEVFPVASASALDNLNQSCAIEYNLDKTGTFPRVEWPTTMGTTYSFAIFSETAEGEIEFRVEDLGTIATVPAFQCTQCDVLVEPGPDFPLSDIDPLTGIVTSVGIADIIEEEDELRPSSPDMGVCNDGFGVTDPLVDWRQRSRANDFCAGLSDLAQSSPAEFDAWLPSFTPLNGAPQSDIFLPNYSGAGAGGAPDSASSYDLSASLVPLNLPFSATIEGRLVTDPFTDGDLIDHDHFGFTVPEPAIVRWTVTAGQGFHNEVLSATGKLDPMTGLPDMSLGFDCASVVDVSDGGGRACEKSLSSAVVYPGVFYLLSTRAGLEQNVDCLSGNLRLWWGDVEIFTCPMVDTSLASQLQSDRCRTNFFEYELGSPVFVSDGMSGNLIKTWPNGQTRFSDLIDEFNHPVPGGLNQIQAANPLTGDPLVDIDGEPVLVQDPSNTNTFLLQASFQIRDVEGNLQFDSVTGAPRLKQRAYFTRTAFIQAEFIDLNRGCNADVADGQTLAFDEIVTNQILAGSIGRDPYSESMPLDIDWYRFTPMGTSVEIRTDYFADLFIQVYEEPTLVLPGPCFVSTDCPGGTLECDEILIDCNPLILIGGGVSRALPDAGSTCTRLADDADGGETLLIEGLTPGNTYAIQIQIDEPLSGGAAHSGAGPQCEDDPDTTGIAAYLLEIIDENFTICTPDLTTSGATLPGQPGFGVPDEIVDLDDLGYFLGFFLNNDPSVADVTSTGATLAGQAGFGEPDGEVDLDDLGFFLNAWLVGCI
ncbi:MAG: GC-type dockerin domain-anchored protein [Planctomycetota bacterium]